MAIRYVQKKIYRLRKVKAIRAATFVTELRTPYVHICREYILQNGTTFCLPNMPLFSLHLLESTFLFFSLRYDSTLKISIYERNTNCYESWTITNCDAQHL